MKLHTKITKKTTEETVKNLLKKEILTISENMNQSNQTEGKNLPKIAEYKHSHKNLDK